MKQIWTYFRWHIYNLGLAMNFCALFGFVKHEVINWFHNPLIDHSPVLESEKNDLHFTSEVFVAVR